MVNTFYVSSAKHALSLVSGLRLSNYTGLRLANARSLTTLRLTLNNLVARCLLEMNIPHETATIVNLELLGIRWETDNEWAATHSFMNRFRHVRRLQIPQSRSTIFPREMRFELPALVTYYGMLQGHIIRTNTAQIRHLVINTVVSPDVLFQNIPLLPNLESFQVTVMRWNRIALRLPLERFPHVRDLRLLYYPPDKPLNVRKEFSNRICTSLNSN